MICVKIPERPKFHLYLKILQNHPPSGYTCRRFLGAKITSWMARHDVKTHVTVIAKSVKHMNWHSFTFVYQTDEALSRIQETLKNQGRPNYPITIRELQPLYKINILASEKERDNIYESLVKEIKSSQQYSLLLDVENENLSQLLDVMNKMGLMSDYFMCLITDLLIFYS
ncbi:hypothetical protein TSAR_007299 [Trichomalopsis sarcophagae]|uniref:Receptor ligand binding region domain-containing protein n=1 Tax=Trichomalopsis sarcophagae TaxID=543379 RepID=A0A232FIZ9_9HYME|nr:hypothetical protein TSAR_007299 [Trichomalopsis sarcophagae]